MCHDFERQLEALRRGLDTPVGQHDLDMLFPVVVPFSFLETNTWPGPIEPLKATDLALTWAVLGSEQTMTYVFRDLACFWEQHGIDWRTKALQNVWAATENELCTGQLSDDDDEPYLVVLMHADGLGPSRLLLPRLYSCWFPDGYSVAVPERSCALVFRRTLTPQQEEKVEEIIQGCFANGTNPMSSKRFRADLFWQPFKQEDPL